MTDVSVAMCTLNGARFLRAQLESLASQRLPPSELVVCDDGSEDETLGILEDFATSCPFPIRIVRNTERKGITPNFSQAISLCTGTHIALADQDDIWQIDKLDLLDKALERPNTTGAFCDATIVDCDLTPLSSSMWQHVGFNEREQAAMISGRGLEVLVKHFVVTGATLMFRSNLRSVLLPIPESWPHDAWIAAVLAAAGDLAPIARKLIRYRQHDANATGARKLPLYIQYLRGQEIGRQAYLEGEISRFLLLADRLDQRGLKKECSLVMRKIAHLRRRQAFPRHRLSRFPHVLDEWTRGDYGHFSTDWRSIAMDVFFP